MRRKTNFRVWDGKKQQMMGPFTIGETCDACRLDDGYVVIPSTGVFDRNGREIFEGDILSEPTWWWGPRFVHLSKGHCGVRHADSVMSYILAKDIEHPEFEAVHHEWSGRDVAVIGNIFETPHLL